MRAMILAAGLGTRMRPLSDHVAKPAVPVLGRPVIAWLLELLYSHGVREVTVNLHPHPESIRSAISRFGPRDMRMQYLYEEEPLGTGGGIETAREFLAASNPSLVLTGDMLLDVDLRELAEKHRASGAHCTLLLLRNPQQDSEFGTIGLDSRGRVCRIAERLDLGGEVEAGVFVGLRLFSPAAFETLPQHASRTPFEDLSDWLGPLLRRGEQRIRGHILSPNELSWTPVGTPAEYLRANLSPPSVSYLPPTHLVSPGTQRAGEDADLVLGAGARLGNAASLRRCVVWENERVPADFRAEGGVFAGGNFYPCDDKAERNDAEGEPST